MLLYFILVYIFYNATDGQETQSEETAFVQLDRKLRVMKCRGLQISGTVNPSAHFLVDDRRKFIYCWIPKVIAFYPATFRYICHALSFRE